MSKRTSILFLFVIALLLTSCHYKTGIDKCDDTKPASTEQAKVEKAKPSCAEEDYSDFCKVTDSIPNLIVELRYCSTNNFVGRRIDGYEAPVVLSTKEAASALRAAANELRTKGYRLKIFDAYRPQRAVNDFLRWAEDPADTLMKATYYPDITKESIFRRGFVARKSSHSRGSTFDLTIVHASTGKEVDMGGTFDYFGNISHTDYDGVSEQQHLNRILLRNVMVRHGFKPVRGEWWHFTLTNEPYPETYFTFPVKEISR